MSSLLARIARTLTQHWKRSLAAAVVEPLEPEREKVLV
jgi:hypothetical protein